ncbi:calcium-binding protein, partial [Variovorax sp. JS1663]|uniref:calcium-binding protein n=1 Tax=Variovorax sp. JS1663 TaxID=1851577 RepID=UPI002355ABB9
ADIIHAGAGDDTVNAGAGDDIVFAGSGIDAVAGYEGDDFIEGGEGGDILWGDFTTYNVGGAASAVRTGIVHGATWTSQLQLDPARHGRDFIDGGEGDDAIVGGGQADELYGGAGDDLILGDDLGISAQFAGDDYLDGGGGDDILIGGGKDDTLDGGDGADVLHGDDETADLAGENHGNDLLDGGDGDDDLIGGGGDDVLLGGAGDDLLEGDRSTGLASQFHGNDYLEGGDGEDTLWGNGGNDVLMGGSGIDYLDGAEGDDLLEGGDGKDTLLGSSGNDVLIGGKGNDYLDGGEGDDRYVIATDDVDNAPLAELLTDSGGTDTVEFQGPVSIVGATAKGELVLALGDPSQQRWVLLDRGYTGVFENIIVGGQQFDMREWLQSNSSQPVDFTVQSGESVWGAGGADRLSAADGARNVTLNGGKGNDYYDLSTNRSGGATVELQLGDGIDTVDSGSDKRRSDWTQSRFLFGQGITRESLQLAKTFDASSQSLQMSLAYGTQGDRIFLKGSYFDTLELADGSSMTWQQLADKGVLINMADDAGNSYGNGTHYRDIITGRAGNDTIYSDQGDDVIDGGAGNDIIYSHEGNDVIDGGAGNDQIYGGQGSDVFLFGKGDGQDRILDSSAIGDQDVLRFKAGVSLADVLFIRSGDDLVANLLNSTDKVTVVGAYSTDPLHRVEFSGGPSIRLADLSLATGQQQATSGNDVIKLLAMGETVDALAGDDTVQGGIGNDTIDGNAGTDTLHGGAGNDTLRGGNGYDSLYGEAGDDRLEDADGAQRMDGGEGNDTIIGEAYQIFAGAGDDWVDASGALINLSGGGTDTVVIRPRVQLGNTVIQGISTTAGQTTTIRFASGISPASLKISSREGLISGSAYSPTSYLLIEISGSRSDLRIEQFMELPAAQQGIRFVFDDAPNVVLSYADVYASANTATGLDNGLWGTSGTDTLDGLAGNDTLRGLGGNDTLIGGAGNDTLYGGAGDDVLVASSGQDKLYGGQGNDTYRILDGSHVIYRDDPAGRDIVEFGAGIRPEDVMVLRDGNNALLSSKDGVAVRLDYLFESLTTSSGIQEVRFVSSPQTIWTAATLRQLAVTGNDGNNVLNGFDGLDDAMAGGGGNDRLDGGTGNDTLDGGAGHDYLIGGAGNDTYSFQRGGGQDILTDSAGVDAVQLGAGILPSDVTLIKTSSSPTNRAPGDVVHGTSVDSLVIALASGEQLWIPGQFTTAGAIESIRFADGTLWAASDINARLINSVGTANTQTGTSGNDTYTVDHRSDQIIESAGGGTDLANSSVSYSLPNNVENLMLTGILNINATGNDGANVITGNAGDNVLDGGAGGDTLIGGLGNDTYIVEAGLPMTLPDWSYLPKDVIVETAEGGIDTLVTMQYDVRLPDHVENLFISGSTITTIWGIPKGVNGIVTFDDVYRPYMDFQADTRAWYRGNSLDNVIDLTLGGTIGSPVNNSFGGALVDGGEGADRMIGGAENTYFMIDNAGDLVVEAKGGGQDVMISSTLSLTVAPNVEGIELRGSLALGATGDAANNDLRASNNTASNVLTGLDGDDTYFVDASDVVVEASGGGNDRVVIDVVRGGSSILRSSGKKFYLDGYAHVENIAANGRVAWEGDSYGGEGVYFVGNAQDNGISGSFENDTLEGGAGNDAIEDQYRALDTGGARRIDRDELYGGDGDDRLISYFGSDLLDGGAGDDKLVKMFIDPGSKVTLRGGTGNDRYEIVEDRSVVSEDVDGGIDTVYFAGWGGYALGDNVENLELNDNAGYATGNAGANLITTGSGNNTLNGLGGNDTLSGGAGSDTYAFALGDGQDTID